MLLTFAFIFYDRSNQILLCFYFVVSYSKVLYHVLLSSPYSSVHVITYLHGGVYHVSLDLSIKYLVCLRMFTSELYSLQPSGFVI
jgi:hypothetical protein